eukprot:2627887-Prymnesium_polylepis.1
MDLPKMESLSFSVPTDIRRPLFLPEFRRRMLATSAMLWRFSAPSEQLMRLLHASSTGESHDTGGGRWLSGVDVMSRS